MEFVAVFNGLGNQMSQFAFYLAKKKYNPNCRLLIIDNPDSHNGYELARVFNVDYSPSIFDKFISLLYRKLYWKKSVQCMLHMIGFRAIIEPRNYDYSFDYLKNNKYGIKIYVGGWHSEKYFTHIEKEICTIFDFSVDKDLHYQEILNKIRTDNSSISIHIRRGDYLNIKPNDFWQLNGVATDEYYRKSLKYITEKVQHPHLYVFSNDIEWCKQNIQYSNVTFVSCNKGTNSWRDMQLMSECRHHIIANSTFSWWGAWLSKDKNGIIIHPQWFIRDVLTKDFYPDRWICLA